MLNPKARRFLLRVLTSFFPLSKKPAPPEFQVFLGGKIPADIKESLIDAYQLIFSEEPWNEEWKRKEVAEKIKNDLEKSQTSFLSTLIVDNKVKGFIWGDLINPEMIKGRAARALGVDSSEINTFIPKEKVLYFDEFALLKEVRKGPDPSRIMLRRSLEYAYNERVYSAFCWSTPESKIVPLALIMGYEICGETHIKGKKINFFYYPGFKPMLKMTMLADGKNTHKLMKIVAKNKKKYQ